MMDVVPAKDKSISAVNEKDGMIFLKSQEGILRIIPEKGGRIFAFPKKFKFLYYKIP